MCKYFKEKFEKKEIDYIPTYGTVTNGTNVSDRFIKLINDTSINPKNAQLICSTHNTLLLEECRRDQVWFMDKNEYGESKLLRLSDFLNIRKNDNISEKYLKGVFGAIPKFK